VAEKPIQQFQDLVYQNPHKRSDAVMTLVDALTVAGHGESLLALCEETPFWRKFSIIFNCWN